jgi:hypothetical protein
VRIGQLLKNFEKKISDQNREWIATARRTSTTGDVIQRRAASAILRTSVSPAENRGTQEIRHQTTTKRLSLQLTVDELEVLLPLASDQLFHNEFIDIKMPGFHKNIEQIRSAKAVISRIKERLQQVQQKSGDTAVKHSISVV